MLTRGAASSIVTSAVQRLELQAVRVAPMRRALCCPLQGRPCTCHASEVHAHTRLGMTALSHAAVALSHTRVLTLVLV